MGVDLSFQQFLSQDGEQKIWFCAERILEKVKWKTEANPIKAKIEIEEERENIEPRNGGSEDVEFLSSIPPPTPPPYIVKAKPKPVELVVEKPAAKPGHVITKEHRKVVVEAAIEDFSSEDPLTCHISFGVLGHRIVKLNESIFDKQILLRFETVEKTKSDRWVSVDDLSESFLSKLGYDEKERYGKWTTDVISIRPMPYSYMLGVKFYKLEKIVWLTEREWMKFIRKYAGKPFEMAEKDRNFKLNVLLLKFKRFFFISYIINFVLLS